MRAMNRAYALAFASLIWAAPCLADPIIGAGTVMGNGTALPRTPTETPLFDMMTAHTSIVTGNCLNWGPGVKDAGSPCTTSAATSPPQGRLTFATGVPVMTSDVTASGTVYYTPYGGNIVPVWNGSVFVATAFTELSQALTDATKSPLAAAAANVYDVFVWNDGGTLRATRGPTWASGGGSNTARGAGAGSTALVRVNGLLVNQVAITNGPGAGAGTYVGTIATDGGGATVTWSLGGSAAGGKAAVLDVWNAFNRVRFNPSVADSTASHTYQTAVYRSWNTNDTMRVSFVVGRQDDNEAALLRSWTAVTSGSSGFLGIGLDSSTAVAAGSNFAFSQSVSAEGSPMVCDYSGSVLGAHYLQVIEKGNGTSAGTYYGGGVQIFIGSLSQ